MVEVEVMVVVWGGGGAGGDTDGGNASWSRGWRRDEKKKELLKKKEKAADGQGEELCGVCPYLSGVKTGKAALFIKVSHPSAPYSSAPNDWER